MWMELQGKKATHDFLSLNAQDSSFQLQEPRPPPYQGFILKTHDFLRPLERAEEGSGEAATGSSRSGPVEHVLPGGIGTYSISHVPGYGSLVAAVKAERDTCSAKTPERKPETSGSCGTYSSGGGFTLWEESTARETGSRGQCPPPSSAAARGSASFGSLPSLRHRHRHYSAEQDKKRLMDSPSNPMRGFHDEEEDEFGKREASAAAQRVELMVKVDEKGSVLKQPSTLRSKHSATEQRRRSKINDRFQILRDLIPHSDQKRDKASFLLEVIEYIQFLQEKVQKYDALYPACDQETSKLTPWVKVYFRSLWKNARKNSQGPGAGIQDPSPVTQNGTAAPGFMFSGNDNSTSVVPAMPTEFDICASGSYKSLESAPGFSCKGAAMPAPLEANLYASAGREASFTQPQQTLITDSDNLASESQPQLLRSSCLAECTVSNQANEHEELTIDEGTISVSNVYSQGLLTALSQALHSSGIDLSQARISVQINLGKQAIRRPTATTPMSSAKDHGHPFPGSHTMGHSRVGSSGEESEHASKRHKPDNS